MKTWPNKDPQEVLDYGFNWSPRGLDGTNDYVVSSTATVVGTPSDIVIGGPTGKTAHSIESDKVTTTTWLKSGSDGNTYSILLHAVCYSGRELEETLTIKVLNR